MIPIKRNLCSIGTFIFGLPFFFQSTTEDFCFRFYFWLAKSHAQHEVHEYRMGLTFSIYMYILHKILYINSLIFPINPYNIIPVSIFYLTL